MHPNEALIHRFYTSLDMRDAEALARCYHPDVAFRDPVFGELRGERVRDMWRMLAARAKDLSVTVSDVRADDRAGRARWVADYRFGKQARPVRNVIDARFEFRDGLIVRHEDTFDLTRWASMALGPVGRVLGWTPMLRRRIRRDALGGLERFVAARAGPP